MNNKVLKEAIKAYADCNMEWDKGEKLRDLNWKASEVVSRDDAIAIMEKALGKDGCYNYFEPGLLLNLPENAMITLAREHSVCVYVKREPHVTLSVRHREKIEADESSYEAKLKAYRFWWD